jgi:hypothetical protein
LGEDLHSHFAVAPEQFFENLGLNNEKMAFFFGAGAQQTGLLQQAGCLAKKVPLAQRVKGNLATPRLDEQPDLSFLDDKHSCAGFSFIEKNRSGWKNPAELLKKKLLLLHRPSFVSS